MAILINHLTNKRISLRPHHIFGRRKDRVDTYIEGKEISLMHASIRWEDSKWVIVDHSKNGTWIDGVLIKTGESIELRTSNNIAFSRTGKHTWRVAELGKPNAVLVSMSEMETVHELTNFHVFPDEQNPMVSLYKSEQGIWLCEDQEKTYALEHGAIIYAGSQVLQFFNGGEIDSTLDRVGMKLIGARDIQFKFFVSLDEEHTLLRVTCDGKEINLGERVHHYLLITLARLRLKDAKKGLDINSQGWVEKEKLCAMLGMDQAYVNIQIYRARKQVVNALSDIMHLPQVVESRSGSLRFGFPNFQIIRGSRVEGNIGSELIEAHTL